MKYKTQNAQAVSTVFLGFPPQPSLFLQHVVLSAAGSPRTYTKTLGHSPVTAGPIRPATIIVCVAVIYIRRFCPELREKKVSRSSDSGAGSGIALAGFDAVGKENVFLEKDR